MAVLMVVKMVFLRVELSADERVVQMVEKKAV